MRFLFFLSFLVGLVFESQAVGQTLKTDLIASNLKNPCGVVVRPASGEVFVADTGRGRVVQVNNDKLRECVVGFPVEEFELDKDFVLGPLSIIFRGRDELIVGTGGQEDGVDGISVFDLKKWGSTALDFSEATKTLQLPKNDDGPAEGDFFNLARSRTGLFATCLGDGEQGWVAKADLVLGDIENFRRFIPTSTLTKSLNPGGIAISPDGHIVVAQMGMRDKLGDSMIAFYSEAGELLDRFPTGLNDIVALAYGPRKKRLYALDFNWAEPEKGGLYKLVAIDSKDGCEAELVKKFERPTSMAFDKAGNLYVATCGFGEEDPLDVDSEYSAPGKLFKVRKVDN